MARKTILMIHGFGTGGWVWDGYVGLLEQEGFRCIAVDLPCHGMRDDPPPPQLARLSISDYVAYVENEIGKLDERPIVMAHSAGTLVAQLLAAKGLVSGVVLLTPIPPAGIFALNLDASKTVGSVLKTWRFWRKPVRVRFEELTFAAMHLSSLEEQKRVYDRFGYESGRAFLEVALAFFNPYSPLRVDASKVTCPVLVVAGTEDRTTRPPVAKKIANKYGADYLEFGNHAHWPLGEPGWEVIAQSCADWIGDQDFDAIVRRPARLASMR